MFTWFLLDRTVRPSWTLVQLSIGIQQFATHAIMINVKTPLFNNVLYQLIWCVNTHTYHLSCSTAGSSDEQTHLCQYQGDARNYS